MLALVVVVGYGDVGVVLGVEGHWLLGVQKNERDCK
jgi:hypothetical protein